MKRFVVDLAIEHQLNYRQCYDRLLAGKFGPVERENGRLFVVVPDDAASPEPAATAEPVTGHTT